nr:hypothetical protein [Streptomyces globisporus]
MPIVMLGPGQIEAMRDLGGREILVVEERDLAGEQCHQVGARQQMVEEISAAPDPEKDTGRAFTARRVAACVLQCLDSHFEEEPLLRIHDLRLARRVSEVCRVELFDPVENSRRAHEVRIRQNRGVTVSGDDVVVAEAGDRLLTLNETLPEFLGVRGSGSAQTHSDNGNASIVTHRLPPFRAPMAARRLSRRLWTPAKVCSLSVPDM